jgi:hypothetical protein
VPRGTPYEPAAESLAFPPFRVSAREDLSELVTADRYLASNATRTPPPDPAALTRVWACGSNPLAAYPGSGAYFLDRAAPGVWRLQLYPDVFTVADPYTGSPEPKVRLVPGSHPFTLRLPDLGERFSVWRFDGQAAAASRLAQAQDGTFTAEPGDYLLTRAETVPEGAAPAAAAVAPRYVAPPVLPLTAPLVRGRAPPQWRAGVPLAVQAECCGATGLVARFTAADGRTHEVPMKPAASSPAAGRFEGLCAGETLTAGIWGVSFRATGPSGTAVWPEAQTFGIAWLPAAGPVVPLLHVPATAPAVISHGTGPAAVTLVPCPELVEGAFRSPTNALTPSRTNELLTTPSASSLLLP